MIITFKEFLAEARDASLEDFLKKNCKIACADIVKTGKLMYRGMKPSGYTSYDVNDFEYPIKGVIKTPRNAREPRDTPLWAHNAMNKFFKTKFNIALRSDSLFVTTRQNQASLYGDVHAIIPLDKFDIYWSPSWKAADLTLYLFPDLAGDASGLVGGIDAWKDDPEPSQAAQEEKISEMLKALHFEKGPNQEAIKGSHGELMLVSQRYLALDLTDPDGPNADDLIDIFEKAIS